MANSDKSEWRLYDSDLTTQLAILPFKSSQIYLELNEPGSGALDIALDTAAASQADIGQFCALYYRGNFRAGFFVDNLKHVDADNNENGGRNLNLSGRGALALLEQSLIWASNTEETKRTFTGQTKAAILIALIDEAQDRGELATLTYDFTADVDSAAVAWTDSEDYSLPVGTNLLDVARQFAETGGFDFTIDFSGGGFVLGAYSAGRGTNIASTTYLRVGSNCEEVGRDTRSDELYNYYLVKWKSGYVTVSDATSITAYGQRTKFLSLEQAQSAESATTYASAQLALTKDPQANKTVKVYDGVNPRLFVDYDLGDTVSLDRFGTVTSDKIMSIQADFDGSDFAHVVIDFNVVMRNNEMRMSADLNWLLDQWNTAHDADLLETNYLAALGSPGYVYALALDGDTLYVAGNENTGEGGGVRVLDLTTFESTTIGSYTGGFPIRAMCVIGSNLFVAGEDEKVWKYDGAAWTNIGTIVASSSTATIYAMTTDGTDLYVGGNRIASIDAVAGDSQVFKYTVGTDTWSAVGTGHSDAADYCYDLCFFGGVLYGAFYLVSDTGGLQKFSAGAWSADLAGIGQGCYSLAVSGSELVIGSFGFVYTWDGVAGSATQIAALTGVLSNDKFANRIAVYLTDIYIGGAFTTIDAVSGFTNLAKYSGGVWYPVTTGLGEGTSNVTPSDQVYQVLFHNADFIFGGRFQEALGYPAPNLAAIIHSFDDVSALLQEQALHGFDLAGAINNAPANAVAATDRFVFYDASTTLISKTTGNTGTGQPVMATSPTLVTPVLGVATATSINKVAITAPATSATLTIADGKTFTVSETLTLTGSSAGLTLTVPATGTAALLATANVFTANQKIATATDPKLTLDENNSGTSYGYIEDTSANAMSIRKVAAAGVALIDIDPQPTDGVSTSNASFRFFRSTNVHASALVVQQFFFGDNSATLGAQISTRSTANTYFALDHKFGIGNSSPAGKLTVKQESTTGAIPTIELEQTDLSEEFINFISTVGAGNPIDTAALGAYYGKVRVQVQGVGYKFIALYN